MKFEKKIKNQNAEETSSPEVQQKFFLENFSWVSQRVYRSKKNHNVAKINKLEFFIFVNLVCPSIRSFVRLTERMPIK